MVVFVDAVVDELEEQTEEGKCQIESGGGIGEFSVLQREIGEGYWESVVHLLYDLDRDQITEGGTLTKAG